VRDQRLWTWHVGAGLVILVLLGLHMTVMHLDAVVRVFNPEPGHPIDWVNVVARGRMAFFLVSYVALLAAALFHGFYGLRNILFELNPGAGIKKALNALLLTAGVLLFALGTWSAWAGFQLSRSVA
jgi:succinate dehydrogenase / fumarate reductase membrane anchor subunit